MHTRRNFLTTLGMAAGVAFAPKILTKSLWQIPQDLVAWDGPATLEWCLAAAVAELAANLPHDRFRHVPHLKNLGDPLIPQHAHYLGISFSFDPQSGPTRREVRERFLKPAMAQLADEINFRKPRTCFALPVPNALEYAGRIVNEEHGLDLRFCRAWDIGHSWTPEDEEGNPRLDAVGEPIVHFSPPGWINRFDIAVA
jgi:hypothetical protein